LNYRPTTLYFRLLMNRMFFAPFTEFFKFKFPFLALFPAGVIINPFTDRALHFY